MEAKDHLVNDVLRESTRFMVPLYQRQYQWRGERLGPFWEDVVAKATAMLEGSSKFHHYMGALIVAPGGDGYAIGVTPRMQVVDGQQRLTTFQIFLAALREVAKDRNDDDTATQVHDYLFNPKKASDTDPLAQFKLSPTPADRVMFHDIVKLDRESVRHKYAQYHFNNGKLRKGNSPAALFAYDFFLERIETFARYGVADKALLVEADKADGDQDPELACNRLESLLRAMLSGMKLVVITLDEADDAQVIFETLNSQGQPLLAMDLVRNNIFHRAEAQGESAEELYEQLWEQFDALWWREDAPRARPRLPRIDHFLSHVLVTETGNAVSMRELYAEYRAFARPKGQPQFAKIEDELQVLTKYAPIYETLEQRIHNDETIVWLGRKLATWDMSSAYPVAFAIGGEEVEASERQQVARLLYSYIVRRGVCGLSTKSLYAAFHRLAAWLKENGATVEIFQAALDGQDRDAIRFPSDGEFRKAILERPVYQTLGSGRLQDVLWEVELSLRTSHTEKMPKPGELSIEHVLPRRWGAGWPFADGSLSSHAGHDDVTIERNTRLDRLGNLTLATGVLNSALGNKDFAEKRERLSASSLLLLNRWFTQRTTWSDQDIEDRGHWLADLATDIWPAPKQLQSAAQVAAE